MCKYILKYIYIYITYMYLFAIFLFRGDFVFLEWIGRFPFQCPGTSKFAPPSNNALAAAVLTFLTA